jgi:hypothetical protein
MRRAGLETIPQTDDIERQRRDTIGTDFIKIELELADTFCKLALESRSPERTKQHEFSAHRALDAALHTLTKLHLKEGEAEPIVTQIEEVKALLEVLEANGGAGPKC